MFGGKDQEIYRAVAQLLTPILPDGAKRIVADAKIGDDWSEVSFEFVDATGKRCWFSFDQHPARTAGDIGEQLMQLRKLMAAQGTQPLDRCRFTLESSGRFAMDFVYDDSPSPA